MAGRSFASDNYSGVHPKIMAALVTANEHHVPSYGADPHTESAIAKFRQLFGHEAEVFFVYNGTGANVLGLKSLTQSFNSIFCSELAHINVDESTGPELFTGCKLIPVPHRNGKITPEAIEMRIKRIGDQHHPQPKVISISQCTEYGTVYSAEEIKALSALAKKYKMRLHMDGSRISNAAVSLGIDFREFTVDSGVDVLSFGGTKNGLMFGEAVVVFHGAGTECLPYLRKQAMQLHSKMRFISAQFNALLENDLWRSNAKHANTMAKRMEKSLQSIPGITITQPVQANGVFAIFPASITSALQNEFPFYVWDDKTNEVRLMCSFDTTAEDVDRFVEKARSLLLTSV